MRQLTRWLAIATWLYSGLVQADITLDAPNEVPAGAEVVIEYTGDVDQRDFVTIVPVGAAEGTYSDYQYTRSAQVGLRAPEEAGSYEIRYLDAQRPYATRARQALTVTAVEAALDVPSQVEAGERFSVSWTGPDNQQDFISVADPNKTTKRNWLSYVYTTKGSPVTLVAPDQAGRYEIRYQTGKNYYTLARAPLVVAGTDATIEVPSRVQAGQAIKVHWTGPDNQQDFVAITAEGADLRTYHHYRYTSDGSPLKLRVPDEPGSYEVRYQTGQSHTVLASQVVAAEAVTATLNAPDQVQGGTLFEVVWAGPDNPGDWVAVTEAGADERAPAKGKWVRTRYGSPAELQAPFEPGDYEIRYQMGQSGTILATRPLQLTPPPEPPGQLIVSLDPGATGFAAGDAVEIILDASGSMLKRQDGRRRIEIAREVLLALTGDVIPEGTPFALRVFGHKQANACRTDLEVPLGPLAVASVDSRIQGLQARNLARTPIAASLELVSQDLAAITGERVVILITDGEETCGGDPAAVIETLKQSGVDVRVNIVGFAIDDEGLRSQFRYWASLGGGDYHDASTAGDLARSMHHALQAPYRVFDQAGTVVANGTIGGAGVELAPGEYSVRTNTTPALQSSATVVSGKTTGVTLQ